MPIENQRLPNARIDQHPPGEPSAEDLLIFWDKKNGTTKQFPVKLMQPQVGSAQNFEWISNRKDELGAPLPYNTNEVVTRGGTWFQSLTDNNTETPGVGELWQQMDRGFTGGFWAPGIYPDPRPWVFSDHTGVTQIYELKDPERPFKSVDIEAEIAAGKWVPIIGGGGGGATPIETLDVSDSITIDLGVFATKNYVGNENINSTRNWSIVFDAAKATSFRFLFTISSLQPQNMPEKFRFSDALFHRDTQTWEPLDIGTYEMEGYYDGNEFWYVKIFGPYRGGNSAPGIFNNTISYSGGILDGPRTYSDPEGDLENNPKPEVRNLNMSGDGFVGNPLTVTFDFHSPSGYLAGIHKYQWADSADDGTDENLKTGETSNVYTPTAQDIGRLVYCKVIAVQVADAPANGNPESNESITEATLVQEVPVEVTELDLSLFCNHYLKLGTYDNVNNRAEDLGTFGDGTKFFQAPVGLEPVLQADGSLLFDDTSVEQALQFEIEAGDNTEHDFVMVFTIGDIQTQHLWALRSNVYGRVQNTGAKMQFGWNGSTDALGDDFDNFVLQTNTPYAMRVRFRNDGANGFIRLQVNKNVEEGFFEYDKEIMLSSKGQSWGAILNATIGSNLAMDNSWNGKIAEIGMRFESHIAAENEDALWTRLNNVKALIT